MFRCYTKKTKQKKTTPGDTQTSCIFLFLMHFPVTKVFLSQYYLYQKIVTKYVVSASDGPLAKRLMHMAHGVPVAQW